MRGAIDGDGGTLEAAKSAATHGGGGGGGGTVKLLEARVTVTTETTRSTGPRQHLIEVSFPAAPVSLYAICFANYYCAAISVSHTHTRSESDPLLPPHMKGRAPTWQVVVPKLALMTDPHCEVCAAATRWACQLFNL